MTRENNLSAFIPTWVRPRPRITECSGSKCRLWVRKLAKIGGYRPLIFRGYVWTPKGHNQFQNIPHRVENFRKNPSRNVEKSVDGKKITRRPCCRRDQPRNAGHLYRKLVPNSRARQWIETTLKLPANIGKLSKNHFTSASVKDWCMSPHGVAGPLDQSSRNSENKFRLARPPKIQNFVALRQKVCEISVVGFCSSEK